MMSSELVLYLITLVLIHQAEIQATTTPTTATTTSASAITSAKSREEILDGLRKLYLDDPNALYNLIKVMPPVTVDPTAATTTTDSTTTETTTTDTTTTETTTTDTTTTSTTTTDTTTTDTTTTETTTTGTTTTDTTTTDTTTTDTTTTETTTTAAATTTSAPTTTTLPPTTTTTTTALTTTTQTTTTAAPTTTTSPIATRRPWPKPNCGNSQVTNELRELFLNTHNRLRGRLARGQTEKSRGWGTAPPATNMYRMKYNCDAESHAQQYVYACNTNGLPEYTHRGYQVNRHVLNNPRATKEGAAKIAMNTWWSQLARNGIKSNMLFDSGENRRGANNVLSWSKMAWWDNIYLGCSVKQCGSSFYTVCMYRPGGNRVNQHVYRVGRVCSDCAKGQCDGDALCRW